MQKKQFNFRAIFRFKTCNGLQKAVMSMLNDQLSEPSKPRIEEENNSNFKIMVINEPVVLFLTFRWLNYVRNLPILAYSNKTVSFKIYTSAYLVFFQ